MSEKPFDPIKPWFKSAQDSGEYIGIRFGRIPTGSTTPEWIFLPHSEVDGIGGFADILRKRGVDLCRLPQIKHPSEPSRLAVLKTFPKFLQPRRKLKWRTLDGATRLSTATEEPTAVAWHVFSETTTTQIRRVCRKANITVNSFLVKHLTKAIRPYLQDEAAIVPWMIPVNLRGKITRDSDVDNHSSFITLRVASYDTLRDVHKKIYAQLAAGNHWANWFAYDSSRFLSPGIIRYLVDSEKYMPVWHIGSFSNLGDWDAEKSITQKGCDGDWLFCPPVLRVQHLGTGCMTFQNRLSLMIQAHPELTTSPAAPKAWVQNWVKEIEMDLASILAERGSAIH
ncbi:MAG: hypothetical protein JWM68_2696 [Verrucomicrobiales bacterium]|nr:hypothetical protein [Verrucomicrobiales bacterium]